MKKNGFTLVELIIVIILLGILSAVTIPRFFTKSTFENSFDRSEFSNALAWVRNRTITSQCAHEVRLTSSGWTTFRDSNCSSTLVEAGCSGSEFFNFSIAVSDGSNNSLSSSEPQVLAANSPTRLIFTSDGQLYRLTALPSTLNCTTLPSTSLAPETNITLNIGTLIVDGGTAYVEVQ